MNANKMTFGIEIETVAPDALLDKGLWIGDHHCGAQVPYLWNGWKAEHDGSIRTRGDGHACEIVSPVLRGAKGLARVAEVVQALKEEGHRVNSSCSVHVHVGWKRNWPAKALARLVTIVSHCERGLYAITGSKRRERSTYCDGIREYGSVRRAKPAMDCYRNHALNLVGLTRGIRETVEFRMFSGSLSATKICGWIQVCLGLVERAINGKRSPTWTPKPLKGRRKKAGEGASETERLIGYLAWGAGYARIHGGHQYGWISDVIPQDEVKSQFRRLAAKYDSQM